MLIEKKAQATLPTEYGIFEIMVFEELANGKEHVAMVMGEVNGKEKVLSRIHSECLTGDVFHSLKCDCGFQLNTAMQSIAAEGCGVLIYHRAEGRGIGLTNKIKAYALQDQGLDTVEANEALGFAPDMRDYNACAEIYAMLGVKSVELMTNNPDKIETMRKDGINIVARRPLVVGKNKYNEDYLRIKTEKMDHMFTSADLNSSNMPLSFDNDCGNDHLDHNCKQHKK
ncbi:GTP cyclohydrolase II [Psittacicella hinzii]|uniref:GTP cyclohydrolase-2 n=1 Tax=Psittacicella hinzii TaxID=2028575 RepID=A0A3A1Y4Z8_9GAMM|nr:GTP cyclohydrolase II [Psittacicella hinzii]RIY32531.1 GTP cyclohydrolase II [Psittacicella hinzii]